MKSIHTANLFLAAAFAAYSQGQPNSAVQFFDSTGTTPTSKFGWSGSPASGKFYIETPNGGTGFTLQNGNVAVEGNIKAATFTGNGSGLTGITATGASAAEVATTLKADAAFLTSVKGAAGPTGPQGATGPAGPAGPAGSGTGTGSGAAGPAGPTGPTGPTGATGAAGATGAIGATGAKGDKGDAGTAPTATAVATTLKADATFVASVKGAKGDTGPAGTNGSNGDTGKTGSQGIQGVQGPQGPIGKSFSRTEAVAMCDASNCLPNLGGFFQIYTDKGAGLRVDADNNTSADHWAASFGLDFSRVNAVFGAKLANVSYAGYFNGFVNVNGSIAVNGGCNGCSNSTSDRNLKKDIKVIESAGEKLKKINGVSFLWNEKGPADKNPQFGVVAQDVQQALPDAVRKKPNGELSVEYNAMTALLIEAVKEQGQVIEKQQKQIDELRALLKR